jgi:tetratricopeptide (TPR) repeat protein
VSPGLGGLATIVGLLAANTLTLARHGLPEWVCGLGQLVPIVLLLGGIVAAVHYRPRPWAAILALSLGIFAAAWMAWLQAVLFSSSRALGLTVGLAAAGVLATLLVLRWGGSLFRILLAATFCYLGLQALQNWSRFALVAGTILAWSFGEWAAELRAAAEPGKRPWASWGLRLGLVAFLGLWIAALAGDRFYPHTGEPRHFALREQPLEFAHEAVQFAGQDGLPRRALVYGLGQTGLYVFHNAPRCKPFLDGRLEMPDTRTFQTYVDIEDGLRQNDPRWEKAVAELGNPLLLLEHQDNHDSEANLLAHPGWRCVYFDALAAVFIPSSEQTEAFPSVDFAARHFAQPATPLVPNLPGAAAREEKALYNLAASLPRKQQDSWKRRAPLLQCALDRGQQALAEDERRPDVWTLLGNCYRLLDPHLHSRPPALTEPWRLERSISWAQATWSYRRALEAKSDHAPAWRALFDVYGARDMADVQLEAGRQWLRHNPQVPARERAQKEKLLSDLQRGLKEGRLQAVLPGIEKAEQTHPGPWRWDYAEQLAALYMHLGRPADARRVWQQATGCPSEALRQCRLGSTFWVERSFDTAREHFQQASKDDPQLAEAAWALAMLHTQLGDAEQARQACRRALKLSLNAEQRLDLENVEKVLPW